MKLSREELKTKSGNLICLYEYLVKQENRRIKKSFGRDGHANDKITDLELRNLIHTS